MFQITAAGHIGKDAVIRNTQSGDPVVSFSVGCKVQKGREQSTEWLSCSIWGKRGEALAQYLVKGQSVTVTGALTTREHEGKTYLECRVAEVALQGGKREGQQQSGQQNSGGYGGYGGQSRQPSQKPRPTYSEFGDGDEIPF